MNNCSKIKPAQSHLFSVHILFLFRILFFNLILMQELTEQNPVIEIIEEEKVSTETENRVVLYNDDWHTFEEVIVQLIKAIKCNFDQARSYAFEVHVKGKAIVFNGSIKDCLKVSSVLEEIALNTQIVS